MASKEKKVYYAADGSVLDARYQFVQEHLSNQDLRKLKIEELHPLTPEVISRQATINVGTIGHVAHGKSTVVKAISGVQTVRFKNELERNITIKLGYANAKIYRNIGKDGNPPEPGPGNYCSAGSEKADKWEDERGTWVLERHVSFVDWLVVAGAVQRPIRFVMYAGFDAGLIGWMAKQAKVIPIAGRTEKPEVFKRAFDQPPCETANLQVHLESGDTFSRTSDFEVHIAAMVFRAQNIHYQLGLAFVTEKAD